MLLLPILSLSLPLLSLLTPSWQASPKKSTVIQQYYSRQSDTLQQHMMESTFPVGCCSSAQTSSSAAVLCLWSFNPAAAAWCCYWWLKMFNELYWQPYLILFLLTKFTENGQPWMEDKWLSKAISWSPILLLFSQRQLQLRATNSSPHSHEY